MLPSAWRTRARAACIGVKKDGAFKTLHDGGKLVRAKMRLEVREVIDRARLTNAGSSANFARQSAPRCFDSWDRIRHGFVLRIVCLYVRGNST